MIKVLVVDDEPQARKRLLELLRGDSDFTVVGESEDGQQALTQIRELHPELLLLDIKMPGLSGLDLSRLLADEGPCIIFTTAYGEHALEAFAVDAVDYLLKPFDEDRFREALHKVRERILRRSLPTRADLERLQRQLAQLNDGAPERLAIKDGTRVRFLNLRDILHIQADGDYLHIHSAHGESAMIRERLRDMQLRLAGRRFVRISRSLLLNLDFVREMKPHHSGDYAFVLQNGERFVSGPTYREAVHQLLARLKQDS